jgi:Leucine-rich repeat (LRR) protein
LESLFLSKCYKLKALPENIGILKSLKTLFADETAIVKLAESIFRLTKLERLVLNGKLHWKTMFFARIIS